MPSTSFGHENDMTIGSNLPIIPPALSCSPEHTNMTITTNFHNKPLTPNARERCTKPSPLKARMQQDKVFSHNSSKCNSIEVGSLHREILILEREKLQMEIEKIKVEKRVFK